jgi:glycosyltransferase involved in cell wall biosynthesis
MRAHVVDPPAFSPPYDHALCSALASQGVEVELITSRFAYGAAPIPDGYLRREVFYRRAPGAAGSWLRRAAKVLEHVPDMVRYRRLALNGADVVHFQWLDLQWLDAHLLPARPVVLTAHDLLPREPRPGQAWAQRRLYAHVDVVIAHSEYGREQLVHRLGVPASKVRVIHHGAFDHLTGVDGELPRELLDVAAPVVLFFGLLRPYKGVEVLLEAWRGIDDAELWIVGRPRMGLGPLQGMAPPGVRFVPRFVSERELAACFRRADVVVLPYLSTERFDQSGVMASALAFGKPIVASDIGGFGEVAALGAARLVPPGDASALRSALAGVLGDAGERERLAGAARAAAAGEFSWQEAARRTASVYEQLVGAGQAAPQSAPP